MVKILDLHFQDLEGTIASFLVETSEGPVLFETGPHSTFPHLEEGLKQHGYRVRDVKHVFLTHIHLDHAGAAWAMAREGAAIYLHPFGAKHMADPGKLMSSARRIYRDDMDRLWGDMQSIPEAQLRTVAHRESITVGDHTFVSWHTPGHAVHHIAWQLDGVIFTGDVAGVKLGNGPVAPPCPPPDINIEDWIESIKLIKSLNPEALYLTHFGKVDNIVDHFDDLTQGLEDWANWIREHLERGETAEEMTPKFQTWAENQLADYGVDDLGIARYNAANPPWMSVAGLIRYWKKRNE